MESVFKFLLLGWRCISTLSGSFMFPFVIIGYMELEIGIKFSNRWVIIGISACLLIYPLWKLFNPSVMFPRNK